MNSALEEDWPKSVVCSELHDAYLEHAHAHGDRHPLTSEQLGHRLRKLCPEAKLKWFRPWGDGPRPRHYALQTLDKHRDAFLSAMCIDAHEWPQMEGGE